MKDDTISRAAAIDALADYIHNVDRVYSTGKLTHDDCMDAAHSVLDELPSAQPGWIPCSEFLPENGRVVLWCNEHGSVFTTAITARFDNSWAVGKRHRSSRMVAWCPLPEPYKEGEQP